MLADALLVLAGYLVGSIPSGIVVVRLARGEDIRTQGSGNIGASNVWRTYGKSLGIPVAVLDVLKGFVPALAGFLLGGDWVGVLAGAAAMLGHARPVYLGFRKGGKMVATAGGVTLALAPLAALCCLAVWLVTFAVLRYASLASIVTAAALPAVLPPVRRVPRRWSVSLPSPLSASSRSTTRTSAACSPATSRGSPAAAGGRRPDPQRVAHSSLALLPAVVAAVALLRRRTGAGRLLVRVCGSDRSDTAGVGRVLRSLRLRDPVRRRRPAGDVGERDADRRGDRRRMVA